MNKSENIIILFFNKDIIHNILYNSQTNIRIEPDDTKINLYYNFYLVLLILDKENTNYEYNIEYIRKINNERKRLKNEYRFLLMSKIVLELIKNYKSGGGIEYNESREENELKEINEELENINNRIEKECKGLVEVIQTQRIDKILIEIIKSLIINRQLKDYQYTIEIMNILEIEKIELTNIMFDELLNILNSNEKYIDDYKINNINDLLNIEKINFYYFILKFILKNSIYIYQFTFLLKTRIFIIQLLKSKNILYINKNTYKERIEYIFIKLIDSKYYSNLYVSLFKEKQFTVGDFNSFNEDNNTSLRDIKTNDIYEIFDYKKEKDVNNRLILIEYFNDKKNKNKNIFLNIFKDKYFFHNITKLLNNKKYILESENLKENTVRSLNKSNESHHKNEYIFTNNVTNNNNINNNTTYYDNMNDFINNNLDSKDKDKDKFRNKNLHIKNYSDCFYNSSYNDAVKNQKDLPLEEDYNFYIQDNVPIFGKEIIEMGFVDIYYGLMQILEKCSCRFIIKEGNIDIKFIFKDRDNSEKILEYETLSKALAKNERDFSFGEYHTLYVNGVKLMNYIEQIKQYINKNKICNNFDIKLEVIENEDNNEIKNI